MLQGKIPQLAGLVADVWVDERHRRELEVTQNPIEFGAPNTDHAFVKARKLSVTFGVSNTPLVGSSSFTSKDRVEEARLKLFELQDSVQFLTVHTISGGIYENCLLAGIGWSTSSKNPHATIFELDLQEVTVTKTKKTNYQPLPADKRVSQKASTTKKRGETSKMDRSIADEVRRNHTADASSDADEMAKSAAANAQAEVIAASNNKTLLKQLVDLI